MQGGLATNPQHLKADRLGLFPSGGRMKRQTVRVVILLVATIACRAAIGSAQTLQSGTIAGVVRDTSGAVLPGVTVEASSPALIEKVRTGVTDNEGVYKLINLTPGTYAVTFTLPGFSVVKRDGLEINF